LTNAPNILMIAGNTRHAGKTTLACGIIRKFRTHYPIIGLKVTNVKTGDEAFHGNHSGEAKTPWYVFEETDHSGQKDTSQMLQSGAERVFFIRAAEPSLKKAFNQFNKLIPPGCLIVCESRSLRQLVKPGIFIILLRDVEPVIAKDVSEYIVLADEICSHGYDPKEIDNIISRIQVIDNQWYLNIK